MDSSFVQEKFIRKFILLPGETCFNLMFENIPLEPGISLPFIRDLKQNVGRMKNVDKVCMVSFDEVFLRGSLILHRKNDVVNGFENLETVAGPTWLLTMPAFHGSSASCLFICL